MGDEQLPRLGRLGIDVSLLLETLCLLDLCLHDGRLSLRLDNLKTRA